jgi:hypothetical protein
MLKSDINFFILKVLIPEVDLNTRNISVLVCFVYREQRRGVLNQAVQRVIKE